MTTTYPDIQVGQRLTADLANSWLPLFTRKIVDTGRLSTTVIVADPELSITSIPATKYYKFTAMIKYNGLDTADIKSGWFGPTNATLDYENHAPPSSLAAATTVSTLIVDSQVLNGSGFIHGCTGTGTNLVAVAHGLFYSGDGGTLEFRWAQNASIATNSTVCAKSFVMLEPIA